MGTLMTIEEVAERLQVSAMQIRILIDSNQLAAINVGNGKQKPRWRISREAVAEFEQRRSTSAEPLASPVSRRAPKSVPNYV
jgi:excisionase family DNA binding protein